jgi:transcriptional regulator with PAS, ATPase and Fis domain
MFEIIKTKLWSILKEKKVSLAMVYNNEGKILWHKGREIVGKTVEEGDGFSKSYIRKSMKSGKGIERENIVIVSSEDGLPESAFKLAIKAILIQPIDKDLFLYVDSGINESFTENERGMFKMFGDMLGLMVKQIKKNQENIGGITGRSEAIEKVKKLVLNFSIVEEPILLKGETGVGKNHIAEQIHRNSGRKGNFVVVHTPSINENLFESEIFGHKKGAFTDAKSDRKGLVSEADGGTLFFDEISEIPLSFQTKLLRFIETKKYRVLGESSEKEADVRIVTATNRNLSKSIAKGEFREDLYFRLQVLEIEIPPLRQRKGDLKKMVLENHKYLQGKEIGTGFWDVILNYAWPGNVRELFTVLKRAGIMLNSPITGEDIQMIINQGIYKNSFKDMDGVDLSEQTWEDFKAGKNFWELVKKPFLDRDLNRSEAKKIISEGLMKAGGRYKNLLKLFNLKETEYKKFMKFVNSNRLQ